MQVSDGDKQQHQQSIAELAVIVVHWRVPELLRACLASLDQERERSSLRMSVLVVDTDPETSQPPDCVAAFNDIAFINTSYGTGYAAGCNAGIQATSGQAVLLLNPDTRIVSGAIDRMWQVLFVSRHIGLVAPRLLNTDGSIQSNGYRFPGIVNTILDLYPVSDRLYNSTINGRVNPDNAGLPIEIDYPLGAAMMVKRNALEAVGGLNEDYGMYCEEIDLARRLDAHGWTRLLVPDAEVIHHGGQSTRQIAETMNEALWLSRAKYHWRWSSRLQRSLQSLVVDTALRRSSDTLTVAQRRSNSRIARAFRDRDTALS